VPATTENDATQKDDSTSNQNVRDQVRSWVPAKFQVDTLIEVDPER